MLSLRLFLVGPNGRQANTGAMVGRILFSSACRLGRFPSETGLPVRFALAAVFCTGSAGVRRGNDGRQRTSPSPRKLSAPCYTARLESGHIRKNRRPTLIARFDRPMSQSSCVRRHGCLQQVSGNSIVDRYRSRHDVDGAMLRDRGDTSKTSVPYARHERHDQNRRLPPTKRT